MTRGVHPLWGALCWLWLSPLALGPKLRWNAGWQYYHYRQDFALVSIIQNYHANTGYTSLQWSF